MQRSALCRSRRELSNAHLVAKFCFDITENEPCKVCPIPCGAASRHLRGRSRKPATAGSLAPVCWTANDASFSSARSSSRCSKTSAQTKPQGRSQSTTAISDDFFQNVQNSSENTLRLEFSLIAYLTRAAENDAAAKQSGSLHILLFEFRMGNALSAVEESF